MYPSGWQGHIWDIKISEDGTYAIIAWDGRVYKMDLKPTSTEDYDVMTATEDRNTIYGDTEHAKLGRTSKDEYGDTKHETCCKGYCCREVDPHSEHPEVCELQTTGSPGKDGHACYPNGIPTVKSSDQAHFAHIDEVRANYGPDGCGPDGDPLKIYSGHTAEFQGLVHFGGDTFGVFSGDNAGSGRLLKFDATGDKAFCVEEKIPPWHYYYDPTSSNVPTTKNGDVIGWSLYDEAQARMVVHPDKEYAVYAGKKMLTFQTALVQVDLNTGTAPYKFTGILNAGDRVKDSNAPVLNRKWVGIDSPWGDELDVAPEARTYGGSYGDWSDIPASQFTFGRHGQPMYDVEDAGFLGKTSDGKNAALNGYAMKPRFTFVTDPTSGRRYGLYAWATSAYRTLVLKVHFDVEDDPSTWDVDPNWVAPSG